MTKPGRNNRILKIVGIAAAHAAGIGALVWIAFNIGCPIRRFFGVPCPSCGISRSFVAFLHGNLCDAFYFFPLFFIVPPVVFLLAHQRVFHIPLSKKAQLILGLGTLVLVVAVYILRVFVFKVPFLEPSFERSALYRLMNR